MFGALRPIFGGAAGSKYAALSAGLSEIEQMKTQVSRGICVGELGARADELCERCGPEVSPLIDEQLRCVYEKQLRILRDAAVEDFRRTGMSSRSTADEYRRMVDAERSFVANAEDSTRKMGVWSYDDVRMELRTALRAVAAKSAAAKAAELKAAQQRAQYFTVLRKLVTELEEATQAHFGLDSPVDAALAWRVPDTNINLSAGLQRAKTTVQLSVVPDDSAALLGPSGFNKPKLSAGALAFTYKADFNTEK